MECKDFQKLINDFIFDKIEYSEDLKEFLNHAKTCKNCGEELELYYTIRRGLGDVKAPDGSEESVDATQELENIINFYDELYPHGLIEEKQKVANEMRQFAEETIDVSITMQPVINYFKNGD